jgi:hypothetical protein
MNEHERGFLAFLAEPSKRRIGALLELGSKRRPDLRRLLDHAVRLDPRFCRRLEGGDASSAAVEEMLRKQGAPSACHVMAADGDLDEREMPLREALDAVIGSGSGAFVSCIPGRLGFYEYEDAQSSHLLSR